MKTSSLKYMALVLSLTLAMGPFIKVSATESEPELATESEVLQTPEEGVEESGKNEELVQVILPTSAAQMFDFILDPQELIRQTNGAAYGGKTFEEGATLFFERTDGKAEKDYTSDSNAIIITNRGDTALDVKVSASVTVSMAEGLVMTDDREFTDDARASLYLALTDGETTVPITFEEEAVIETVLPVAEDAGENTGYSFWLTGACNKNGDWSEMGDMTIDVTVTWEVVSREEEPAPENEKEITPEDADKATPSTAEPVEGGKATPSDATASEAEKEGDKTPPDATASQAEKNGNETPPVATASEVVKEIKKTTPKTAVSDKDAAPIGTPGGKASTQSQGE